MLPVDDPAIYPVSGGSEAIETALKLARAYHLARGEPEREVADRASRQLSRQYARRARPVRPAAAAPAVRAVARPVPARLGGVPVPRRRARGARRSATARRSRPSWTRRSARIGPGRVAAFIAEPIVGATLAAVVPPDDYWPAIADGLRRARRPAHRRRGHDRVRADRSLVRARPLGRPAGPARRRQGRDRRLLAVRVRGRERATCTRP